MISSCVVSWLYIKFREPPSDSSQCMEAVKETAAAATAWAKKVIVLQADGTGMDSEIADTSVAAPAVVGATAAAAEAVAIALASAKTGNCNNEAVLGENTTAGLISDERGRATIPLSDNIQATVPFI